jgi:hypothetical protein
MKKTILILTMVCGSIGYSLNTAQAAGYEPYYPAVCCDYMGFENCVNYDCVRPKPQN